MEALTNLIGFDLLGLFGGLCLFLFGMNIMGEALERRAGSGLQSILGIHESLRAIKSDSEQFKAMYQRYAEKYLDRIAAKA